MKKEQDKRRADKGLSLLLSIIVVFGILGVIVFSVAQKISAEMEESAIQNLSESLDLIESTIEAILNKDAEYQQILANELALATDLEEYIKTYQKNQTMVKVSLIRTGETEGISNTGERFSEDGLNFSTEGTEDNRP